MFIFIVSAVLALILQFGFIHRYLYCSKEINIKCNNKLCDYYGNGMCERGDREW